MVFAFFTFVLWALTTQPDTLVALLLTPIWFMVLGAAWVIMRKRPSHLARHAEFQKDLAGDKNAATELLSNGTADGR